MISNNSKCTYRKVSDIHREHALFELFIDGVIILDVGFSNDNIFQVCFNKDVVGPVFDWDTLKTWIEQGRAIATEDKEQ